MKLSRVLVLLAAALALAACSASEPMAPSAPAGAPRYDSAPSTATDSTTVPTETGRTPFLGGSAG